MSKGGNIVSIIVQHQMYKSFAYTCHIYLIIIHLHIILAATAIITKYDLLNIILHVLDCGPALVEVNCFLFWSCKLLTKILGFLMALTAKVAALKKKLTTLKRKQGWHYQKVQ